jgi:hypothetical protein
VDKLIKTLPKILAAANGSDEVAEAVCVSAWKYVVGEALNSHTEPVQLKDQTLVIAVQDNIWQKQLEQLRGQLLFRLNAVLGQKAVKSIEVSIQPQRFRSMDHNVATKRSGEHAPVPIELVSAAAEIQDAGLRRAFLGAATSCVTRLESQRSDL